MTVTLPTIISLTASLAISAAAAPGELETAREHCATELSMLCAGRRDALGCLQEQRSALTERCRQALAGPAATPAPTPASSASARSAPAASGPPPGGTPIAGVGNVWFEAEYSGLRQDLFPKFRDAISAEIPGALRRVADLFGQPAYASGFPHPLTIRIEYDATQQKGLGTVDESVGAGSGLTVIFNLAHWEDCPSKDILRSLVTHELSHAVLHDAVGDGRMSFVPQWFDEGAAMLAGGEPSRSITLESAYYRHGRGYPGDRVCPLDNEAGLATMALLGDCYPFYLLAVQSLAESSAKALPGIVADLRSGTSIQESVPARAGVAWNSFAPAALERARKEFRGMSPLSHITGRGWWRQLRWCRS